MKLGVVLSGGGIRGIAHIGFLKALEELGVEVSNYSGASSGSIIAALAAAGYTADEILDIAKKHQIFSFIKPKWPNLGLTALDKVPVVLKEYISENSFEKLEKPMAVSISGITSGKYVIKSEGPLFEVIQASCSIPILFKPVEIDGELYVDGGLMNNLPSQHFRNQSDIMIGVNLVPGAEISKDKINGLFQIAVRTFELAISNNAKEGESLCDLIIQPSREDLQPILYTKNIESIFEDGYAITMNQSDTIKNLLYVR